MTRMQVLDDAQLKQFPAGWEFEPDGKAVRKQFLFNDFKQAWNFMSEVAVKAEDMNHHPEWFNVYSRVDVRMTTHDADGVTALDLEMALFMEQAAKGLA